MCNVEEGSVETTNQTVVVPLHDKFWCKVCIVLLEFSLMHSLLAVVTVSISEVK